MISFSTVFLALFILFLIFDESDRKLLIAAVSLLAPALFYGFIRLAGRIARLNVNGPGRFMRLAIRFFGVMGLLGVVMMSVEFIVFFPNGFSPTLPICMGVIIAVLDEEKKHERNKAQPL